MSELGPLLRYFDGEKNAAIVCGVLGVVSLGGAFWLWRHGELLRAMLYPLAIVGALQLAIGIGLYARTPGQVRELTRELEAKPGEARQAELARMQKVNRSFVMIEIAEGVLIVVGLALFLGLRGRPASAVGLGLVLEASAMLAFDAFAEQRAHTYTEWLR